MKNPNVRHKPSIPNTHSRSVVPTFGVSQDVTYRRRETPAERASRIRITEAEKASRIRIAEAEKLSTIRIAEDQKLSTMRIIEAEAEFERTKRLVKLRITVWGCAAIILVSLVVLMFSSSPIKQTSVAVILGTFLPAVLGGLLATRLGSNR